MFYNFVLCLYYCKSKEVSSKTTEGTGMKVILFILSITVFSTESYAKMFTVARDKLQCVFEKRRVFGELMFVIR